RHTGWTRPHARDRRGVHRPARGPDFAPPAGPARYPLPFPLPLLPHRTSTSSAPISRGRGRRRSMACMERPEVRLEASGEVSERNELLSGAFQVVLDGVASLDVAGGGTWTCAASVAWQLGREGEVPLAEG